MFAVDLGHRAFDVVILGNICHLFSPERTGELIGRVARALRPGGRMAIIDHLLPERLLEGDGAARSMALYALGLLLRTEGGEVHPEAAFVRWLERAGLRRMRCELLSESIPVWLIVATATPH